MKMKFNRDTNVPVEVKGLISNSKSKICKLANPIGEILLHLSSVIAAVQKLI